MMMENKHVSDASWSHSEKGYDYLQEPTSKNKSVVEQWSTGAGQPDSAHVNPIVVFCLNGWLSKEAFETNLKSIL